MNAATYRPARLPSIARKATEEPNMEHQFNLPWTFDGRTIYDGKGTPVAVALDYTSVRKVHADGKTYNTSEYAGLIRAETICRAVNERQP